MEVKELKKWHESRKTKVWTKEQMMHHVKIVNMMKSFENCPSVWVLCEMVEQLLTEIETKDEAIGRLY